MSAFILFTIGVVCIAFPTQSTNVMQKALNHVAGVQARRFRTPVAEEDITLKPVHSIIIGFFILALALFAYLQSSG